MDATTQKTIRRGERGSIGAIMALLLVALAGVAALAVDLAAMHVRRSGLQTSADSAAMAGANALISYGADLAKVRSVVLQFGQANLDSQDQPTVAIQSADIVFYKDGVVNTTAPNQVEVTVHRAQARKNPMNLFFGRVVNVDTADLSATARAGVINAASSKCLKPWSVAAKFTWNDRADTQCSGNYNNGVLDVDSSKEMATVVVQGYGAGDLGAQIVLKAGDPHNTIVPGQYNAIDYPPLNKGVPSTGACNYSTNISGCAGSNAAVVEPGDKLQTENGCMTGPTRQGVQSLIATDPGAYWDTATNSVKGSSYKDPLLSPRVTIIPFYDPRTPPQCGRAYVTVYQLGAVFLQSIDGNGNVTGRFLKTVPQAPNATGTGNGMLAVARLIEDSSRGAAK